MNTILDKIRSGNYIKRKISEFENEEFLRCFADKSRNRLGIINYLLNQNIEEFKFFKFLEFDNKSSLLCKYKNKILNVLNSS